MCVTHGKIQIPAYVLHTEKCLSVPCVTHEKLFGHLDTLDIYTSIISI